MKFPARAAPLVQRFSFPGPRFSTVLLRFLLLGSLLILAVMPSGLAAGEKLLQTTSAAQLDEADFWLLVEHTIEAASDQMDSDFQALANEWEALQEVQRSDGQIVKVETSWMVNLLRSSPPQREKILQAARLLLNGRNLPQQGWEPGAAQSLEDILKRPEFQWQQADRPNWLGELWQRILQAFFDFLDKLLGGRIIQLEVPVVNGAQWVALAAGLLLIGLLVSYALRNLYRTFAPVSDLPTHGPDGQVLTAASALQNADLFSSQGDYRKAVRFLYLSALLALAEAGLLRYDRTRTNREYLRSLRNQPELAKLLGEVVDVFDRVWYGYQSISQEDYTHYSQSIAELQKRRQRPTP